MFTRLFNKIIQWLAYDMIQDAYRKGKKDQKEEDRVQRYNIKKIIAENEISRKIIYCSNEHEDPSIGEVVGVHYFQVNCDPMLIVDNVLTGDRGLVFLDSYHEFSIEMLNALYKLTPYERWNVKNPLSHFTPKWKEHDKSIVLLTKKSVLHILKEKGWV